MGKYAFLVSVCLYCVPAFATGDNTHGQGVRFAGFGFDEQQPLQKSQWVPRFGNSDWPPRSRTYKSTGEGTPMRVDAQCEQDPSPDPLFALCSGTVYVDKTNSGEFVQDTTACNPTPRAGRRAGAAAGPKTVPLLAIRGKWTNAPGLFERDDNVVTFACAPTIAPKPRWLHEIAPFDGDPNDTRETNLERSAGLGVLAKCYFWGFAGVGEARKSDTDRLATYQACLRAARAEYCGEGRSHTEWGTIIQVYELQSTPAGKPTVTLNSQFCKKDKIKEPQSKQPLQFQPCFEALWDTEKALCVSHSRYLDMPADCQGKFPNEFKRVSDGDKVRLIHVDPGDKNTYVNCRLNDYENAVRSALVKNRSGLNKLHDKKVLSCENDIPCP